MNSYQAFCHTNGKRLYPDKVPSLSWPMPFVSSSNKRRKRPRYRSASLGDEPGGIVVTMVRLWSERPSTCTLLYPYKVPSLFLSRPFISSNNKKRKPPRYRSASLGAEPVTTFVTTVRSCSERPSTCACPEVPEIVSHSPPNSPGLLGRRARGFRPGEKGKLATLERP